MPSLQLIVPKSHYLIALRFAPCHRTTRQCFPKGQLRDFGASVRVISRSAILVLSHEWMRQKRPNRRKECSCDSGEHQFLLATMPPSSGQRRTALGVVLILLVAFAITIPFRTIQLAQSGAFIIAFQTVVFVSDLITATLLFAQFSILRWRALLALANVYLFTALIAIPYALTFPGSFAPNGLLGAGYQTAGWLYLFWHCGLPMAIIAYVLLKEANGATRIVRASTQTAVGLSVAAVTVAVCGLTWAAVAADNVLPWLFLDSIHISPFGQYASGVLALLSAFALALLWVRRRSVLDLWLVVVICAWLLEIAFFVIVTALRFSLAFYASRVYALVTASVVLLVLLSETTRLYVRLARSTMAERREREVRLMTAEAVAIAHEINQPLVAIKNYALAARRRLAIGGTGDAAKVEELIDKISAQASRAGVVLQSLRAMVKKRPFEMTRVDVGRLVTDSMKLAELESRITEIGVEVAVAQDLPIILADEVQIQQVVLNLTRNAIEAMEDAGRADGVVNIGVAATADREIMVSVADCGPGIAPDEMEHIFEPFYSTKGSGSGLGVGLSLSRAIVEAHGGRLSVAPNAGGGSVFRFTLPAANEGD
jgi:signal transduction histidine kinase